MSSAHQTIIIAAVLMIAGIAGVALVADDADAETRTVSYVVGDRTFQVPADDGAYELESLDSLGAVVPDGVVFDKWKEQSTEMLYSAGSTFVVSQAVTFTATWKAIDYTTTFVVEGLEPVEVTGALKAVASGTEISAASPVDLVVPAGEIDTDKDGLIFIGWLADGADEVVATEDLGNLKGTVTYTAQYVENFAVTFVNGDIVYETTVADLTVPEEGAKVGHVFGGWAVDGEIVDPTAYEFTTDTTFTAVWNPIILTVTFVAGEQVLATQAVPYGQPVNEPVVSFPEGYLGWDYDFTAPVTEDLTVEAKVYVAPEPEVPEVPVEPEPETPVYKVTFVIDGVTITTDSKVLAIPAAPVKEGYDFAGWAVDGAVVDVAAYEFTTDTTFTATFTAKVYTVTFVAGETVLATQTVLYGDLAVEPVVNFPEGFLGFDFDFSTPITADTTINAKVYVAPEPEVPEVPVEPVYKVIFVVDGKAIQITDSEKLAIPEDPSKEGYKFIGWEVGGVIVEPDNYKIAADTEFTASFVQITLTVTLMDGDKVVASQKVLYGERAVWPGMGYSKWQTRAEVPVEPVEGEKVDPEAEPAAPVYKYTDFDFSTPITADLVLYGVTEESGMSVTMQVGLVLGVVIVSILAWAVLSKNGPLNKKKEAKE